MRIVGYTPETEEERRARERPVSTDRWYDRHGTRCWIVQSLNAAGSQVGDATYVHAKDDAIRDQKWREEQIKNWKDD